MHIVSKSVFKHSLFKMIQAFRFDILSVTDGTKQEGTKYGAVCYVRRQVYWYRNAQLGAIRNQSHPFPIFAIRFCNLMKCITSSITKRIPRAKENSH